MLTEIFKQFSHIDPKYITKVYEYFKQYGYLSSNFENTSDSNKYHEFISALWRLAKMLNLKSLFNEQTIKAIELVRCGCPDHLVESVNDTNKWAFNHIKYYFDTFVPNLTRDEQREYTKRSYASISAVCNLTFEEVNNSNQANIVITTGNQNGLGSSGGVLAYAYLPSSSNHTQQLTLVFDKVELWTLDPVQRGILYQNVCCHESLHNMGLSHSNVSSALMAPFYSAAIAIPQQNDDIVRLQNRYGPPKTVTPPVNPPTNPPQSSDEILIKIKGNNIEIPGYRVQKLS